MTVEMTWIYGWGLAALLVPNALRDLREEKIYPRYTMVLGVMGLGVSLLTGVLGGVELFLRLVPGLLLFCVAAISHEQLGYGDGLVVCTLGIFGSTQLVWLSLLLGLLGVLAAACVSGICGKQKRSWPFVPFLAVGAAISLWMR